MPVFRVRRRLLSTEFAVVLMPKTSMHEDHLTAGRKHKVWRSGQISPMQAIAIADTVGEAPHDKFGLCIRLANASHMGAQFLGRGKLWHDS